MHADYVFRQGYELGETGDVPRLFAPAIQRFLGQDFEPYVALLCYDDATPRPDHCLELARQMAEEFLPECAAIIWTRDADHAVDGGDSANPAGRFTATFDPARLDQAVVSAMTREGAYGQTLFAFVKLDSERDALLARLSEDAEVILELMAAARCFFIPRSGATGFIFGAGEGQSEDDFLRSWAREPDPGRAAVERDDRHEGESMVPGLSLSLGGLLAGAVGLALQPRLGTREGLVLAAAGFAVGGFGAIRAKRKVLASASGLAAVAVLTQLLLTSIGVRGLW